MNDANAIKAFIKHHYRHFNSAALVDAAEGYVQYLQGGGKMFLAMAGAMSSAELGLSLAEMIRQDKIHGISCTGANLEEDIYNLVAHDHYVRIPNWRDLTPEDEHELLSRHLNRVTDTCIPEEEAIRLIEAAILDEWTAADAAGERYFPHEFLYRVLRSGKLEQYYQIDPKNSWMLAACEKNLPIFVPGWEDSTTGNIYASHVMRGDVKNVHTVRTGIEYMIRLSQWYTETTAQTSLGFFQIGGGIAGDFPICVVPDAAPGHGAGRDAAVGLLLPDQRLDHELWLVLGCRAQREDHLGKARHHHAQVPHRVRRHDRRAAHLRLRAGGLRRGLHRCISGPRPTIDLGPDMQGRAVHGPLR